MPSLSAVQSVRCLGCGWLYAKPQTGGTDQANPGCPRCGYVGWLPADSELTKERGQRRYVWDRPLRYFSQSG
jgi:phage FluMu protein Com